MSPESPQLTFSSTAHDPKGAQMEHRYIEIVSAGRCYRLDLAAKELYRERAERVPLTRKQWDLLKFLVDQQPRKLVTKDELLRNVWKQVIVDEETVAKTVGAVRKALKDSRSNPNFIETAHGEGYRFIADIKHLAPESNASGIIDFTDNIPLFASVWDQIKNTDDDDKRNDLLLDAAENGDPRVRQELLASLEPNSRQLPWKMLDVAVAYPIPEFIDIAMRTLGGGSQDAYTASDFLDRAAALIPEEIRPEHLASVVRIARYLAMPNQDNDIAGHFGSVIWFLRSIVKRNAALKDTCYFIVQRILSINLNAPHLEDCIAALCEFDNREQARAPWRKHCLRELSTFVPAASRKSGFFNTDPSYYLNSLLYLGAGEDSADVILEATRFLETQDIDELHWSLEILNANCRKISKAIADDLIMRLDTFKHNYTADFPNKLRRLIDELREENGGL
jgi:DNA-binding winged helix-turn-helix (wHTH) protein